MMEFGAAEAQAEFGRLLKLVEDGEEIRITRDGREVARLVPSTRGSNPNATRDAARNAVRQLRERAEQAGLGKFDWSEWKSYRDEGRR